MTRTRLTALLTISASAAAIGHAQAADLPPIYETPIYEAAPELTPVEIGNGWYLRGDVGYGFSSNIDADNREYRPDFKRYPYLDQPGGIYRGERYDEFDAGSSDFDLDDVAEFSVGVGHRFTDYLRGDVTLTYAKADFDDERSYGSCYEFAGIIQPGTESGLLDCRVGGEGSVRTYDLMANAYADLGTFVGLTPYVGGGLGAAYVDYEDVRGGASCIYDGGPCEPAFADFDGRYEGDASWRFAYSLMAGVSYDVSQNLKLDVGYRYLNIDGGDMYRYSDDVVDGQSIGFSGEDDGLERHSIKAGIRYSLW